MALVASASASDLAARYPAWSALALQPPSLSAKESGRHVAKAASCSQLHAASKKEAFDRRFNQFLERNADEKFERRRDLALLQRDLVAEEKRDNEQKMHGALGVEGFRWMLRERYGSVTAAWRTGLDRNGNGRVSYGEFLQCCQAISFSGNLKKLWHELLPEDQRQQLAHDPTGRFGSITLGDLDQEAHQGLEEFRGWVLARFGGTLCAWQEGINPRGVVRVPKATFVKRCGLLGFQGDAGRVFEWLRLSHADGITLQDLDPLASAATERADPCAEGLSRGQPRRIFASPAPKAPQSALVLARAAARRKRKMAATGSRSFMHVEDSAETDQPQLSPDADADPDAQVEASPSVKNVSFAQPRPATSSSTSKPEISPLSLASPSSSSAGSPKNSARKSLDSWGAKRFDHTSPTRNSKWIREVSLSQIADINATMADHNERCKGVLTLEDFKADLQKRYGSVLAGWNAALDPFASKRLGFTEFSDRLRDLGYLGDIRTLWVDLGGRRSPDGAMQGQLCLAHLDKEADAMLQELRRAMCEKHGNMLKAWAQGLDPRGEGVVDQKMFVKQCGEAGYQGDAARLFRMLQISGDRSGGRFLSLKEFDIGAYRAHRVEDMDMLTQGQGEKVASSTLDFHERQDNMFTVKWGRLQASVVQDALSDARGHAAKQDRCTNTLDALKGMLVRRYGSCATAWRVDLDPLQQGHLTHEEFVKAIREKVGYRGDLKDLWREFLGPDSPGNCRELALKPKQIITLHDLDCEAAELMWSFREMLLSRYENIVTAWQRGLDPKGVGHLSREGLCSRCKALAFPGDASQLFDCLRSGPHKMIITLSDIDLRALQAMYRGDVASMTMHGKNFGATFSPSSWAGRSVVPDRLAASDPELHHDPARKTRLSEWSEHLGKSQRAGVAQREQDELARLKGAKSLEDFQKAIRSRWRSTVAAWRSVLDPELSNTVTFSQFCGSLEKLGGYGGKLKGLWEEMDPERLVEQPDGSTKRERRGYITFRDFDAEADQALVDFRDAWLSLENVYNVHQSWSELLRGHHGEQVDEQTFIEVCTEQLKPAWARTRLQYMFRLLLPEYLIGRNCLLKDDLRALILSVPLADKPKIWLGSKDYLNASAARATLKLGIGQSTMNTHSVANELKFFGREDFNHLLVTHFGSVYSGWVRHLDITEEGRVPKNEFVQKAKVIGVTGNVEKLCHELTKNDNDPKGMGEILKRGERERAYIVLRDLDPQVAEATEMFFALAVEEYGSLANCWAKFDSTSRGYVVEEEFVAGCEALGWLGDATQLFRYFRPDPTRRFLFLDDLGPLGVSEARQMRSQQRPPRSRMHPPDLGTSASSTLKLAATAGSSAQTVKFAKAGSAGARGFQASQTAANPTGLQATQAMADSAELRETQAIEDPTYVVRLDRTTGIPLGLQLGVQAAKKYLVIKEVLSGLASQHNASALAGDRVKPGDCIVRANRVDDDCNKMLEECKKRGALELEIHRGPVLSSTVGHGATVKMEATQRQAERVLKSAQQSPEISRPVTSDVAGDAGGGIESEDA